MFITHMHTSRPCATEACITQLLLSFGILTNIHCIRLLLHRPFLRITIEKRCHSTSPESWSHLLALYRIKERYEVIGRAVKEGMISSAAAPQRALWGCHLQGQGKL